jgi:hypothetical protein
METKVRELANRLGGPLGVALTAIVGAWVVLVMALRPECDRSVALVAVAAILVAGAAAMAIYHGRSWGPLTVRGAVLRAAVGLLSGAAAALVPAVLAPQGRDPLVGDPLIALVLFAIGVFGSPRARMVWWVACGAGIGLAVLLGFRALPDWSGLAGYDRPPAGSDVSVEWSANGALVSIVYPLDEPVTVQNGKVRRADVAAAEERRRIKSSTCPDADGEEQAAAEAVISGDRSQAIARARLALQICPVAQYARDVLGSSLLARGVVRLRTGKTLAATADLREAIGLLREEDDLARAHLALGRALESAAREDEARVHFERAAGLAPAHPAGRAAQRELD